MLRRPARPTPFPYTTLFRSADEDRALLREPVHDLAVPRGLVRDDAAGEVVSRLERIRHLHTAVLEASYQDRKSTRLNSSHVAISYAVLCLKKKERGLRASVN